MDLTSAVIGIELGSTRIKAVLIDENHQVLASGAYSWQNSLENGVWVYPLEAAIARRMEGRSASTSFCRRGT